MGPHAETPAVRDRGGSHVVFLNWRDCRNPEGGGSEIYVETVARALVAGGNSVTLHSAAFPGAPYEEVVDGVRIVRGGSKLTVYPQAWSALRSGRLGDPDVVVDVQNGVPFASPTARGAPCVVLVHHVHREQWPVVYGPLRSRVGWFLESRVGPRVYRGCRYVAVSEATRRELVGLGVDAQRIAVVHNGVHPVPGGSHPAPHPDPTIVVVGRLVPHKQVEHVLFAAAALAAEMPTLRVRIIGEGWWADQLTAVAGDLGLGSRVEFLGFVDEQTKHAELAAAWALALPSIKEGWGLVVTEAGAHGVPSVAYRSAGGVAEAIEHGRSGLLVDGGQAEFTSALRRVLGDPALRQRLSDGALARSESLSWQRTAESFAAVLSRAARRRIITGPLSTEATLQAGRLGGSDRQGLPLGDQLS